MLKHTNKKIKMIKNLETLAAVHTHTHTHTVYCLLVNKKYDIRREYKNKDRTMVDFGYIGLSLYAFAFKKVFKKIWGIFKKEGIKKYRAGPIFIAM